MKRKTIVLRSILGIALMFLLVAVKCENDVIYTKGFPFYKYAWERGELMAIYKGSDADSSIVYKKYFNVPDTLIDEHGDKITDIKCSAYKFQSDFMNGYFYDWSGIYINGRIVKFDAIKRERSN